MAKAKSSVIDSSAITDYIHTAWVIKMGTIWFVKYNNQILNYSRTKICWQYSDLVKYLRYFQLAKSKTPMRTHHRLLCNSKCKRIHDWMRSLQAEIAVLRLKYNITAVILTHWGRDKMAAIFQTKFSNAFSWVKMYEFRLRFHWSLFPMVQLTICHYLNQWCLVYWRIQASLGLNELIQDWLHWFNSYRFLTDVSPKPNRVPATMGYVTIWYVFYLHPCHVVHVYNIQRKLWLVCLSCNRWRRVRVIPHAARLRGVTWNFTTRSSTVASHNSYYARQTLSWISMQQS